MPIELPDELIAAETAAYEAIQDGALTVPLALAVHQAVAAFVETSDNPRLLVEEELKRRVRHPEPA
ncbi:hypothetical protein ACFU96_27395 [Streptomyces sp. NPDC057620]|uniref:hypothetical protein n=1 Tax=Streptomyces sp. NPDC057620 TaxID=3346185 RepID=UPI0036A245A9